MISNLPFPRVPVPRGVLALAVFNLFPALLLLRLFIMVWSGVAHVCNVPAVTFLVVIAALYFLSSCAFLFQRPVIGVCVCALAMVAALADLTWIWLGSGLVLTLDIVLQLTQVIVCTCVLGLVYRKRLLATRAAA